MSEGDSSCEEENTQRIREAVWSPDEVGVKSTPLSKRAEPKQHHHHGNELQTTPEFRSFISKKLTAMLDSTISEVRCGAAESSADERKTSEQKDGFRIFSTSLPGNWQEEPNLTIPPRRRPAPSSSDSDSEMEERLKEAAVPLSSLIPIIPSRLQEGDIINSDKEKLSSKKRKGEKRTSLVSGHGAEDQDQRTVEGHGNGDDVVKKKKKKKKNKL